MDVVAKKDDRAYMVIGGSFIETNGPTGVSKTYYEAFNPACCGCCDGDFVNESDFNWCCYCISTDSCYNTCERPCSGGYVSYVPCGRNTCCFCCVTRCSCGLSSLCTRSVFRNVKDSKAAVQSLTLEVQGYRLRQSGWKPPVQQMGMAHHYAHGQQPVPIQGQQVGYSPQAPQAGYAPQQPQAGTGYAAQPPPQTPSVQYIPQAPQAGDAPQQPQPPPETVEAISVQMPSEPEAAPTPLAPAEDSDSDSDSDSPRMEEKEIIAQAPSSSEAASLTLVKTIKARVVDKPNQLSFDKGDTIRVVKATGKWDLGVLFLSDTYPISKKAMYFPANFVTALTAEETADANNEREERNNSSD